VLINALNSVKNQIFCKNY